MALQQPLRWHHVRSFLRSEDGPTAVEYAVMLAFIVLVCIGTIQALGTRTSVLFADAAAALSP